MNLSDIRKNIDEIDEKLMELLEKRMEIIDDVIRYKIKNGLSVLDCHRESEKLNNLSSKYDATSILFMKYIMLLSRIKQYESLHTSSGKIEFFENKFNKQFICHNLIKDIFVYDNSIDDIEIDYNDEIYDILNNIQSDATKIGVIPIYDNNFVKTLNLINEFSLYITEIRYKSNNIELNYEEMSSTCKVIGYMCISKNKKYIKDGNRMLFSFFARADDLYKVIEYIHNNGLHITNIFSDIRNKEATYFLEFAGNISSKNVQVALLGIKSEVEIKGNISNYKLIKC